MELNHEFRVSVPVEQAWSVLTDLERIAPCMPGAELQEVEGDEYRGVVKVKVGPITAQYKGKARFESLERDSGRAVLRAEGRDTRGQGNANATVTATLTAEGDSATRVAIATDLTVTGKVAQFGRGVLADVSSKLLDQFVRQLETDVLSGSGGGSGSAGPGSAGSGSAGSGSAGSGSGPGAAASTATAERTGDSPNGAERPAVRAIESRPAQPVDLLGTAGAPVAKRLVPALLGVAALLLLWRVLRGR
jgi:carbon monoxide dehydrogenase subunit G